MNKKYIKELFEDNKEIFIDAGLDILSPDDLEELMISYIASNMQYDFNIDINETKLFCNEQNVNEISIEEEIER